MLKIYELDTGKKVLALTAISAESRLHTVTLKEGLNEFGDMYLDGYLVKYQKPSAYECIANKKYKVKVKWGWHEKEKSFVLGKSSMRTRTNDL